MSWSRSRIVRAGAVCAALTVLGGCADYLNHRDTITLAAGNAVAANRAIHTVDPQATRGQRTRIYADGKWVNNTMVWYHGRPKPQELNVGGIINSQ